MNDNYKLACMHLKSLRLMKSNPEFEESLIPDAGHLLALGYKQILKGLLLDKGAVYTCSNIGILMEACKEQSIEIPENVEKLFPLVQQYHSLESSGTSESFENAHNLVRVWAGRVILDEELEDVPLYKLSQKLVHELGI